VADPDGEGDPETEDDPDDDGEGDGEGEGEGDGEGEGVGEGEGDGVVDDGRSWHLVSVLAEAAGLGEAVVAATLTEPAWAMPDQAASRLTIRKPPASKLSVVARTCAKRILDCPVWTARHGYGCVLHVFGVD